jgi:quinol monooxygenase YgiN
MAFIQLIEVVTSRPEEIEELIAEWRQRTEGRRRARRGTLTEDRDRPQTFVQIVEFDSYEDAMANSDLPETAAFAERVAKLSEKPPMFRNLDVRRVEDF